MKASTVDQENSWLPESVGHPVVDGKTGPATGYEWNDSGNADRLADAHGKDLIYCRERKSYYVWSGQRWQYDDSLEVERRAEETMRNASAEAGAIENQDQRNGFLSFVNRSLSQKGLTSLVQLARKKMRIISATELDGDPWLLNVNNGTLDLRTGALRPHAREDLISKLIPLSYDPNAQSPLFMLFIHRIMGDGPDASEADRERADRLVGYLQKLLGCCATGKPEKVLAIFYGPRGNNGKTTLLTTIAKALGSREYSTQINIDSLMADPRGAGNNNAANADLADLLGARFAFTSEVDAGQYLSLGRVKYITGQSPIKTRRMRENWITFPPTHKIIMDCNDRPLITKPNDAVWNRLICVPFDVVIPDDEIDTDFASKLEGELRGILAWLVSGARRYSEVGLIDRPAEVRLATGEYQESSDRLREFIQDDCRLSKLAWTSSEQLQDRYHAWCKRNGERHPLEGRDFTDQLRAIGCEPRKREIGGRQTRGWTGLDLRCAGANHAERGEE